MPPPPHPPPPTAVSHSSLGSPVTHPGTGHSPASHRLLNPRGNRMSQFLLRPLREQPGGAGPLSGLTLSLRSRTGQNPLTRALRTCDDPVGACPGSRGPTETVSGLSSGPPHLALPARKHFQASPVFRASPLALGPGEEGGVLSGLDASALWGGQTLTELPIMPGYALCRGYRQREMTQSASQVRGGGHRQAHVQRQGSKRLNPGRKAMLGPEGKEGG